MNDLIDDLKSQLTRATDALPTGFVHNLRELLPVQQDSRHFAMLMEDGAVSGMVVIESTLHDVLAFARELTALRDMVNGLKSGGGVMRMLGRLEAATPSMPTECQEMVAQFNSELSRLQATPADDPQWPELEKLLPSLHANSRLQARLASFHAECAETARAMAALIRARCERFANP